MELLAWTLSFVIVIGVVWILIYDYQRKKKRDDKEYDKDLEIQGIKRKKTPKEKSSITGLETPISKSKKKRN